MLYKTIAYPYSSLTRYKRITPPRQSNFIKRLCPFIIKTSPFTALSSTSPDLSLFFTIYSLRNCGCLERRPYKSLFFCQAYGQIEICLLSASFKVLSSTDGRSALLGFYWTIYHRGGRPKFKTPWEVARTQMIRSTLYWGITGYQLHAVSVVLKTP